MSSNALKAYDFESIRGWLEEVSEEEWMRATPKQQEAAKVLLAIVPAEHVIASDGLTSNESHCATCPRCQAYRRMADDEAAHHGFEAERLRGLIRARVEGVDPDDALDVRVVQLDEICKWLATSGHKPVADLLHESRDAFLLEPAKRIGTLRTLIEAGQERDESGWYACKQHGHEQSSPCPEAHDSLVRCGHKMTEDPMFAYECNRWSGHKGEHRYTHEDHVIARWSKDSQ